MWTSMRILNGGREAQNMIQENRKVKRIRIIMSLTIAKVKISPKGNIRNIQKIGKQNIKGHSVHNNTGHFLWSWLEKLAIMGQKLISYHIGSST